MVSNCHLKNFYNSIGLTGFKLSFFCNWLIGWKEFSLMSFICSMRFALLA